MPGSAVQEAFSPQRSVFKRPKNRARPQQRSLRLESLESRQLLSVSTATVLAVPSASAVYGSPLTFTATVSPAPPDGELVTFTDGITTLGTAPLTSGTASFTTTTPLSLSCDVIRATYNGDGTYLASNTAISPNSTITTIAGGGPAVGSANQGVFAVDPAGNIFIADTQVYRVRENQRYDGLHHHRGRKRQPNV